MIFTREQGSESGPARAHAPEADDWTRELSLALRWLHHEAARCRGRGATDAFCLVLPPLLEAYGLPPMTREEAAEFSQQLSRKLSAGLESPNGQGSRLT